MFVLISKVHTDVAAVCELRCIGLFSEKSLGFRRLDRYETSEPLNLLCKKAMAIMMTIVVKH